jgi:hypothetical protein
MIRGSCLCGGVRFEITRAFGPFELCHCSRCRKANGSAFVAGLGVKRADFRLVRGGELIDTFEASARISSAISHALLPRCGSPVPDATSDAPWLEVPAGLLDDDPRLRPDKHIFVDFKSPWFSITDNLPRLGRVALKRLRREEAQR